MNTDIKILNEVVCSDDALRCLFLLKLSEMIAACDLILKERDSLSQHACFCVHNSWFM